MGNKVPFVLMDVALNDVGVFAQNKLVRELKKPHSESEIFPDEHGHYNLTKQMLSESSKGEYYDGENKIFGWERDSEGCLKIIANTNKQINILADIDAKKCLIEAKGPLFLNGRIKVKNDLIVSADALWISEKLSSKGDVTLMSNQGIAILSPFSAKNLSINTSYLHMDTDVDVAGYLDVSSQFFKQGKSCKTILNGLRLVTTQAEIAGDLRVSGDSFISANNIVLGSKKDETTIQLDGINYIHASNLLSKDNAQLAISRFDNKEPSKFIVDNELIVEKKAIIDFKSTKVIVKKIKNHGEISTVGCELLSNKFYQNGIYDAELSDINIYKQFNQNSRSLSKLTNNNFLCRDFNLHQGRFKFDDCTYEALNTSISGKFKVVNNSKCSVGRNLFLTETADFHVNNSAFSIEEEAYLAGNVSIVDSKLSCNHLVGFSQILLKESDIECKNESSFFQGLQAKNSKVNARKILIKENAVFDNMTLSARNIHFNVSDAQADGISLFAENFDLSGSDSDDKVMFKNGVFILDKFTSSNNATIEKSSIFGVDKRAISHQFYNNLKLVDCCFITESEVRNNKGSSLAIENGSFSARTLYSVGAMHAKNTTLSVDSFKQDHAEFVADSCKIRIKKELSSTASVTQLKDNTSLLASEVKLGEKDDFTLSQSCAVNVSHKISTSVNSNLKTNNSALVTKKFISLGRAEICESILSADELLIYNRFEAKNKSLLKANKLIAIAKTGRAKLSDAYVLSRDFHGFGKLSVNDTHVLSENNLGLSPGSDTKLSGNTVIKAKNIALNGKVAAKKKDSAEKKSNIQFHATDLLYQGNSGVIYGDEDLSLDTKKFLSHGAIDLLASLNIKGKECSNYGMIYANNLHFGFDDSVLNFGSLSAKNMVVHSNFVNFLGKVSARESFSSAGYLSFNFGMIAANNYSNNSLISLNAGLFLPNFSADRKYIFSKSNLMNVAKIGVSSLLPEYKKAINLAFMVPGVINAASDVLNSKEIFNFEKYMNMRRHEWMPLVCRVKGYGLTGLGAYKSVSSVVPTMFTHFDPKLAGKYSQSDTNASYKLSDFTAGISNIDWKSVGVDIASTFTGNYSDNALIRLNAGLIAVGNASNTSLFDINFGFEGAGLSHCVNTYSAQNFGMIHGVDLNVSARHLTNSGYIVSNDRLSLNADNLNNREKGLILARETDIISERVFNQGTLKGSNKLHLKADNLYNSERGTIQSRETDIVSESIINQGKLKGSNKFTLKADSLLNAETGVISGNNFYVDAQHLNQQGKLSLKNGQANIADFTDTKTASTNFTQAYVMGESFKLNGTLLGEKNVLDYTDMCISESANQYLQDTTFKASSIVDNGHLNYKGQVCFITDKYTHNGVITRGNDKNTDDEENQNIFYVKSKEAVLNGSGDLDNAYFNIDHFKDSSAFVTGSGIYSNYHISDNFSFETLDSFKFEQEVNRDCDLTVKAADINMDNINYDRKQDLTLISTQGDVSLCNNITSKNLFVKSARDMWTNGKINVDEFVNFSAEGIYTNLGGTVNGDTVAIKAAAIKNISSGSAMAQQASAKPMGDTGLINGRKNTFLEATQGNIENYGGGIRGGEYCQLIAKGDVLNACNVRTYQGAYDTMQDFDAGLIAGGNGANTDGIGLYIQAGGKIISDASDFISNGINYLEADQGFDFRARQHTYVSNQWTKKKWYGKKETHISTSTTVKGTNLQSAAGKNILKTEHGGLESVATNFISPGGTEIYAKNDVNLYSLKSENREYNYTSKYFGLSKNVRDETHQSSTPNLFYDDGVTVIHSSEGHIDARGAYFAGDGDLEMKAKKRIKFGADILEHEVTEKSRTFGVSLPGMDAYNAYKSSGKIFDAATAEDATLAKLEGWLKSGNQTETIANSVNLGINLYNTTNSIYRGLANDSLGKEMMARYGLGGENGFSPTINFTLTEKTSVSKYQTQGLGGVDRGGNVKLEAGEGIDLENGVQVHAGGDMDINTPEVIARAAGLQSSSKETTKSLGVGITATGEVADVSASYSKTTTQATNFINAGISADGNMKLHDNDKAMGKLELDGATINAGTLDADIDQLIINDKQDVFTSKSESASASSTGAVSAYAGETKKVTTVEHSGIHVKDGINTNGHRVHVGEATMNGGKITSDGKNEIDIDTLHARQLKDEEHSKGMGISFNVNDLQRMAGQKPSNSAGEQAIAVGEVSIDRVNKQTVQNPVIYGAQGTAANIKNLDGIIHTSSSDGATVIKDDELHLQIDVPLTNGAYIKQAQENIAAGSEKIAEKMGWKKEPKIPDNLEMDKNAIPSKREEELSEEDLEILDNDEIDPEIADFISQLSVGDIQFDSPELQELFESVQSYLEQIYNKDTNTISSENDGDKNKLKNAIGEIAKLWMEEALSVGKEAILESDTSITTKMYLGRTGIIFQFIFNMGAAYLDDEADHEHMMKEGVTRTLGDVSIGAVLKFALGKGAGPAGLMFTGLGVMDDFTYNKQFVAEQSESGVSDLWESQRLQRQGQYFDSFNRGLLARDKIAASNRARAGHELINYVNNGFKDFYSYIWNKTSSKSTEKKEANQSDNPNRFFSANKNENSNKYQTKQNECSLGASTLNG